MTATDHKMLIELASEGLDYREHNGEDIERPRRVLDQAKAELGYHQCDPETN